MTVVRYLERLSKNLPRKLILLDNSWLQSPTPLSEASKILQSLYKINLVRRICSTLNEAQRQMMTQKILASDLFKDKKRSYEASVPIPFESNRIQDLEIFKDENKKSIFDKKKFMENQMEEKEIYSCLVDKLDRHGYKRRQRILILTDRYMYCLDADTLKLKDSISLKLIKDVSCSKFSDGLVIIHIKVPIKGETKADNNDEEEEEDYEKGDLILYSENYHVELMTKFCIAAKKRADDGFIKILGDVNSSEYSISHAFFNGEIHLIKFIDSTDKADTHKGTTEVRSETASDLNRPFFKDRRGNLVIIKR